LTIILQFQRVIAKIPVTVTVVLQYLYICAMAQFGTIIFVNTTIATVTGLFCQWFMSKFNSRNTSNSDRSIACLSQYFYLPCWHDEIWFHDIEQDNQSFFKLLNALAIFIIKKFAIRTVFFILPSKFSFFFLFKAALCRFHLKLSWMCFYIRRNLSFCHWEIQQLLLALVFGGVTGIIMPQTPVACIIKLLWLS
jgi:hypothetical protein